MKKTSTSLIGLSGFALLMIAALVLVIGAIERPVAGATDRYDALFTDANGLRVGDDVRAYGVQVGKVDGIRLDRDRARVRLSIRRDTPVFDTSTLAIRYQNLTGQRYVDLRRAAEPGRRLPAHTTIGTEHTVPSFDVTSLFNGLEPVLRTLSPEALNQLTQSLLAVVEGDGSGIAPALKSLGELSAYLGDRQRVITTLVRNMAAAADRIGGRSPHLVTFLGKVTDVFQALQVNIDGLVDFAVTAPPVLEPADRLLATLGFTVGDNPDVDSLVHRFIPDPQAIVDILARLPALLSGLDAAIPASIAGSSPVCSKGKADVPGAIGVLIGGRKVSICKG